MRNKRATPTARRVANDAAAAAVEPQKPRLVVSNLTLARARQMRRRYGGPAVVNRVPFSAPEFPRSVEPEQGGSIAQDNNISSFNSWATSQLSVWPGSAFAEGQVFLGYSLLAVLSQRAEYRVPSEIIASEMTREWIDITRAGEDEKSKEVKDLEAEVKRLGVHDVFMKAIEHDGFFGRGHIYLDTGDTDSADELKLSIGDGDSAAKVNKEKPLKRLATIEPVWTYPNNYNSTDPLHEDWYRPETWSVMSKQIHRTRLLTIVGRPVSDMLKPTYAFGGLSMTQMLKPYVDNWLRTRQSVSELVHSFSVQGLKTDLTASLQVGGDEIVKRIDFFNEVRDNAGAMVLDKDEEWFNVQTSLATLDSLQAQAQEHMAAIARIPLVKLLGISPHGLNATAEPELRAFYDWIHAFQERLFRTPLMTVLKFIQLSLWGKVDPDISFIFNPLWQLDDQQKTAVQREKAATHDLYATMGAVDADEVRESLANDHESPYAGLDLRGKAPGPQMGGGEGGSQPRLGAEPGQEESDEGEDEANLESWIRKAETLFGDEDDLRYWSQRAAELFPDESVGRWAALTAKLAQTSNRGEDPEIWVARVTRVRRSWAERALDIPRNVVKSPIEGTWLHRATQRFQGDLPAEIIVLTEPKKPQDQVGFEHPARGSHFCGECIHYEPSGHPKRCELVDGRIEEVDWCELFSEGGDDDSEAAEDKDFEESKHPRGQPDNPGQFASGGGGSGGSGTGKAAAAHVHHVEGQELPSHIKALKIPPAWREVTYSKDPNADLLVTGRDAKGRRQAIYNKRFAEGQAALKFARIKELDRKFTSIRSQNDRARKSSDPKTRDSADALHLIMETGVRPGSEADTGAAEKAHGATTLEGRHVVKSRSGVSLQFVGKKGVRIDIPVNDAGTQKMLLERARKAGTNGKLFPATNHSALLVHTHSLDGGSFKTKDFRTLLGTRVAMTEMATAEAPKSAREYKKAVMDVAKKVAAKLGNTPTIALQSYISPSVFATWRSAVA